MDARKLPKGTPLIINGTIDYDSNNHFVWYSVTVDGSKVKGSYFFCLYPNEKAATVKTVGDNDTICFRYSSRKKYHPNHGTVKRRLAVTTC